MGKIIWRTKSVMRVLCLSAIATLIGSMNELVAQNTPAPTPAVTKDSVKTAVPKPKLKAVKNTFDGSFIIDNQTVMVQNSRTLEATIQHRFGTINNGYKDMWGLFAPANIRLAVNYTPINNLTLGCGITKEKMEFDGNIKYAIVRQSENGGWPVSVTYYGNFAESGLPKPKNFVSDIDRYSFFHQIMVARKINEKFSAQVSFSLSHINNIPGYYDQDSVIRPVMKNDHAAIAFLGRYKFSEKSALIANYDQPLTQHPANNPHPNISFGCEFGTSGHSFQIFFTNYQSIVQQNNNLFNQNNFLQSRYLLGFNITRKWHFAKKERDPNN